MRAIVKFPCIALLPNNAFTALPITGSCLLSDFIKAPMIVIMKLNLRVQNPPQLFRMHPARCIMPLLFLLTCMGAGAQSLNQFITRLTGPLGNPVNSATVQNTKRGFTASSNKDGRFSIQAASGDTLKISAIGYRSMFYAVMGAAPPAITLLPDAENSLLQPGAGVQRIYTTVPGHLNLASSAAVYNADIIKTPTTTFRNAITGRLAGLFSVQSAGLPGSDGASFSLRGQTPVIIVDGLVANLTQFDLEEIESVTVLKDALGAAMLGVRGSGGAVVVTTRKGRDSKPVISFTAQSAIQQSIGFPKTLGAFDYAALYNEALKNDGLSPLYSDADLAAYKNGTDPIRYPDVNWRDRITKKNALFNKYTLSATGGNKFARYFISLEHVNQNGFFRTVDSNKYNTNNNFKSYVIRSNVDVSINSRLTAGIYLLGRILNGNEPGVGTGSILNGLINTPANAYPALNSNGSFGGSQQFQNNLLAQALGSGYRLNYKRDMLVNMYLKRDLGDLLKGLWIQVKASYYANLSETINRSKSFAVFLQNNSTQPPTYTQYGTNGTQANSNGIDYQGRTDYQELSIGYDRSFGKSGLNVLVLGNRDNSTSGSDLPYTITGTSGRIAYNYDGKYVLEAAYGINGSNRYPNNGRTKIGVFPSAGLGWNIDREKFMQRVNWVNSLKLYGSYGLTGWDNAGYFTYIQRFFDAATAYFGTGASGNTTITEQPLADSSITFEKARKLNLGLTGTMFKNRFNFSVEYFRNKYYDLRMQRGRNTTILGNDYPDENIGQNRYFGWEAQLGWQQQAGKAFQYYISANVSTLNSEVLFVDEVFRQYDWMKRTGRRVGQAFGYVAEGLYQSQADINGHANIDGYTPQPGDIKYKDLNGDGVINQFDIAEIGSTKPFITYGLSFGISYKGFDISALLQGVENRTVYLGNSSYWAFQNGGFGQAYTNNLNRWTPATAATATYPRLNVGVNNNNQAFSSYWMHSGDYIRLKNAEIGYSLPASLIGKIKLQTVRIFINGYNLLTKASDALDGRDPEVFINSYPNQRLYNFGLNIKF